MELSRRIIKMTQRISGTIAVIAILFVTSALWRDADQFSGRLLKTQNITISSNEIRYCTSEILKCTATRDSLRTLKDLSKKIKETAREARRISVSCFAG